MKTTSTSSTMTKAALLSKFDIIATEKALKDSALEKEAKIFFVLAIKNGHIECPFPEWLIKYHTFQWDGQ